MNLSRRLLPIATLLVSACVNHGANDDAGGANGEAGGSSSCEGESGGSECASFCGSDVVGERVCVNGEWRCPDGMVDGYRECPPGTCFGPPNPCCDSEGRQYPQTCAAYAGGLPSGGACPAGTEHCGWKPIDAGPDAPKPDLDAGLAECLDSGDDCALCCDKYRWAEQSVALGLLRDCACSGPCASACRAEGAYCDGTGPSSTCMRCIGAMLDADGGGCAPEIAECRGRADCAPWIDCRSACP